MTLGKRISERRKSIKITQSALADTVGVSAAFISQIETGNRNPSYGLLLKIANALQVSVEFFLSEKAKEVKDPQDKLLFSLIPSLDAVRKKQVLDYIFLISGSKHYETIPLLTSPTEYAQFLIQDQKIKNIPVDVFKIAETLGVQILRSELKDIEGILYKHAEGPLVILDSGSKFHERIKFTLAILLGHLIIPWHLKNSFARLKHRKSLEHDDPQEIEARQFAGELMLPGNIVKKDFKNINPSISIFEEYAYNKYKCSMTALAHKYFEHYGSKSVYLTSEGDRFTRIYESGFPYKLVDCVQEGSFAHTFITDEPDAKQTRGGAVQGRLWFKDIPNNKELIEESMFNPEFGVIVTLLRLQ
jgi:transcriptional regulator with XRE-family HTH domain